MTFNIGRGCVERPILKKSEKWPKWVDYCDETFHTHWYWQDLAQEIVKCHFSSVTALPSSKFWKMVLSLELWRIARWYFAYTLILTRCSQWDCQMTFGIGRGFAEVQILKKSETGRGKLNLLNLLVYFDKHLHTHYYWHDLNRGIAKSSPRDCKMTYNIGRGCVELQILKKWKWPNWADNCNETLYTHCYWQDVAQEIVKCHLGLAEAMPRHKFWKKKRKKKSESGYISWNVLNILIKLRINIVIDVSYIERLPNVNLSSVEAMQRSKS